MGHDLRWAVVLGAALGVFLGLLGGGLAAAEASDRFHAVDTVEQRTGPGELPATLVTQQILRGDKLFSQRVGVVVDRPGRPKVRLLGTTYGDPGTLTVVDEDTVRWSTPDCERLDITVP